MAEPRPNPADRPQRDPEPAEAPRWPMLTRTQERLLLEVWHLQQGNGWCYAGQPHLAGRIGCTDRHVRRLLAELHAARWLRVKYRHGETCLLRVVLPRDGPRSSGGVNPGHSRPGSPRTFVSYPPGHSCPTKRNTNTKSETVGGHPSEKPAPAAPPAPLFDPPARVNLWEAHQRLGQPSVCHTVGELFRRGEVQKVRLDGRLRAIASADVDPHHFTPRIRIVLPKGPGCDVRDWFDEALLKLEFYP